ncbi:VWFA-related domain-containing protein [Granulicella rosea]|uniref:VWFA-related domain-containing protein n=1 Tax=Granulicella rosea TaxID=474952 RepID=A0A239EFP1_9BACT|nr:VWA domain-containing protein [Granulicella rosea]SNS43485.1 VWFA-related domain-containing protein [Granulicella rosea]
MKWTHPALPTLALLLPACLPGAHAQQPEPSGAIQTLRVTSNIVVLDVVVTDAQGNVVPGLKKDDFTILQDNKPQPIRSFDPWEEHPLASAPAAAPKVDRFGQPDWGDTPLTIFVLDDLNTPFDEKSYSAFTLKKYLQAQPAQLKTPSMLLIVNETGLHSLAAYTQDRDVLIRALDKRPASFPDQLAKGNDIDLLTESFAVLRQIALSSEGVRAHKNLVWMGRGFPTVDPSELDAPGNITLQNALKDTVTLLTKVRITLYKVDPITSNARAAATDVATSIDMGGGMGNRASVEPPSEDPLKGDLSFNQFAVQTGGHYFYGRNDLDQQIAGSLERGSEFYTLTYRPQQAPDADAYRAIRIQMRDPSLKAVTRQGFYSESAPKPEPTVKEMGFDLKAAATGSMKYSGVGLQIVAVTSSRTADRVTVNFAVEDKTLTWSPVEAGGESAKILTLLVAEDAEHRIQSSTAATLALAVKDARGIAKGVLNTHAQVDINAKTRFVRLLVRDSNGRIGSVDVDPASWSGAAPK